MPYQFFLEHPSGLNEHAAVDRFVGNTHGSLIWKFPLEPARSLFGRPIQRQFARDNPLEHGGCGESTWVGASSALPCLRLCLRGAIRVGPTMAADCTAYGRRRSTELVGDLPDRDSRHHATRNLFSFRQRQRPARPPPNVRSDPPRSTTRRRESIPRACRVHGQSRSTTAHVSIDATGPLSGQPTSPDAPCVPERSASNSTLPQMGLR